jgi:hypothetical protein
MIEGELLNYEDALAYLGARRGDVVCVGAHPTLTDDPDLSSRLGLRMRVRLGELRAVKQETSDAYLDGAPGIQVLLATGSEPPSLGLVMTPEWFIVATLSANRSLLKIIVAANLRTELEEASVDAPVGWAFTFDFDGKPPVTGRWADSSVGE